MSKNPERCIKCNCPAEDTILGYDFKCTVCTRDERDEYKRQLDLLTKEKDICKHEWESRKNGSFCTKCKRYAGDIFQPTSNILTIKFDSINDADAFKSWMCNQGEQDFYESGKYEEPPVAYDFEYHEESNSIIITTERKEEDEV